MAAGATYTPIATTTLGSAQSSVTFSSLGSYTDLVIVANVQGVSGANLAIQFNGDTGSNYSSTILDADGTTAYSRRFTSSTSARLDYYGYVPSSGFNLEIINVMNYGNSTTYKTVVSRAGQATTGVAATVGLWRNTAAITSVTLLLVAPSTNINTGSSFTLYGILAA